MTEIALPIDGSLPVISREEPATRADMTDSAATTLSFWERLVVVVSASHRSAVPF